MRIFILLLIILSSFLSKAQDSSLIKETFYCGVAILVQPDCQIEESSLNINGNKESKGGSILKGNQFVSWTNYNNIPDQIKEAFVQGYLNQILSHMEEKMGGYKKRSKKFISLNQNLNGWLIELNDKEKINRYFLFASGVVNSEHVIIHCGLSNKPKNNKAIPDFMSQIIQFK